MQVAAPAAAGRSREESVRFIDAIKEGLFQSMQQHPNLILMGQDIAEYGGAFKITEGFVQEFGKNACAIHRFAKVLLWALPWA